MKPPLWPGSLQSGGAWPASEQPPGGDWRACHAGRGLHAARGRGGAGEGPGRAGGHPRGEGASTTGRPAHGAAHEARAGPAPNRARPPSAPTLCGRPRAPRRLRGGHDGARPPAPCCGGLHVTEPARCLPHRKPAPQGCKRRSTHRSRLGQPTAGQGPEGRSRRPRPSLFVVPRKKLRQPFPSRVPIAATCP